MGQRREQLMLGFSALCVLMLACALAWMVSRDRAREARVATLMTQRNAIDPEDVARAVRTLKLVTVQITTSVRVEKKVDSLLFGDAKASVQTPVVASYGTDLSRLSGQGIQIDRGATRAEVRVTIPRPERIAVEVFAEGERADVEKGWRRMVWWSGESALDEARLDVPAEARALELMPVHRLKVERETREQVARLVRMIVAGSVEPSDRLDVRVRFEGEPQFPHSGDDDAHPDEEPLQ